MGKKFEADNVTVTVEWAQQDGVTYTVNVSPMVSKSVIGRTRCRLTIPYNAEYNLSVLAAIPCRTNATAAITLYYGKVYNVM